MEFYDNNQQIDVSSWIDKHKPTKINDIIGNVNAITQIIGWLKSFEKNKKEFFRKQKEVKIPKTSKKKKKNIIDDKTDKNGDKNNNEKIVKDSDDFVFDRDDKDDDDNNDGYNEASNMSFAASTSVGKKNNEKSSSLLITGAHGTGKSCSIYAILNDLGYVVQVINFSRIKSIKNIKEIVGRLSTQQNVISMFAGKKEKTAIVIDEMETLASQTEKACIIALIKNNQTYWTQPIVFISNTQHNKLLGDIKKTSHEIKLFPPENIDMERLLIRICKKENMKIENENVIQLIVNISQKDFRRLVFTMQDIHMIYGTKIITEKIINEYMTTIVKKDTDSDLFKASKILLSDGNNIDNMIRQYDVDKTTVPLMIQENYIGCVNSNINNTTRLNLAKIVSDSLSKADVIENFIHSEMSWDINIAHAFYSCIKPSHLLSGGKLANANKYVGLEYPKDLNRYSIKKINKKNIMNIGDVFPDMNVEDYIYMNQLLKSSIENGTVTNCMQNFKDYKNIKVETIETLIKIDKIKQSKSSIKTKDKREIETAIEKHTGKVAVK